MQSYESCLKSSVNIPQSNQSGYTNSSSLTHISDRHDRVCHQQIISLSQNSDPIHSKNLKKSARNVYSALRLVFTGQQKLMTYKIVHRNRWHHPTWFNHHCCWMRVLSAAISLSVTLCWCTFTRWYSSAVKQKSLCRRWSLQALRCSISSLMYILPLHQTLWNWSKPAAAAAAITLMWLPWRCSQGISEVLIDVDISAAPTTSRAATVHLTTVTVKHADHVIDNIIAPSWHFTWQVLWYDTRHQQCYFLWFHAGLGTCVVQEQRDFIHII